MSKLTRDVFRSRVYTGYYDGKPNEFKRDLFSVLGVSDNPKREKFYSLAYEYGHSAGYGDVYNYALDLVDLIL